MSQIFHPSTNVLSRVSIFGGIFILAGLVWVLYEINSSPYVTGVGEALPQPVPFSHQHHVSGLGLDCRYCHTTVERTRMASVPATEICMGCHTQIWADSPMLQPVRDSFSNDQSIAWTRVHDLPDFVYFDHSIHVNKGIGCSSCHGRIDQMPLTYQVNTLQMDWCLECHTAPQKFIRPKEEVFNMNWQPPPNQEEMGLELMKEYNVQSKTDCWICHR